MEGRIPRTGFPSSIQHTNVSAVVKEVCRKKYGLKVVNIVKLSSRIIVQVYRHQRGRQRRVRAKDGFLKTNSLLAALKWRSHDKG